MVIAQLCLRRRRIDWATEQQGDTDRYNLQAQQHATQAAQFIDVGSLITADATNGTPMFAMVQSGVIQVWVYEPQDDAFGVEAGHRYRRARAVRPST
jgi:hypothetical protein